MPTKLFLHAGLPKTGTTSVQRLLFDNRQALLEQGFYVPTFLQRDENYPGVHAWTSLLVFNEERIEPLVVDFGMNDAERRLSMRAEKQRQLHEALNKYSDYTWIISDEILAARLLDSQDLQSLRENFVNLFAECTIIFFLRNQLESAIGQWSTDLINGSTQNVMLSPSALPEDPKRYLNHQNLLSRWNSCLQDAQFVVQLYDKERLLADFANTVGFNFSALKLSSVRENTSLPACCINLLVRYNELHPFSDGSSLPSELRRYMPLGLLKSFSGYPGFQPDADLREAYNVFFSSSDEWVRSYYFPELKCLWKKEINVLPESERPYLLDYDLETSILNLLDDFTLRFQV
jgi:hypothetical protein